MQTEPSFDAEQAPRQWPLAIRFTGSGSEYFRIWIVNLLLMIVTLGIYYPRAKLRRLRYFYANTLVGERPLGFHGEAMAMFRGFALVAVLSVLYSLAGNVSPVAGLVAFVVLAALWPALVKSAQQFRMGNTSWHGLRMGFSGTLGGAYKAWLPVLAPTLVLLAAQAGMEDGQADATWVAVTFGLTTLVTLAMVPWLWWNLKKYQHDHLRYGGEQSRLTATVGSFYAVFLKTGGVFLAGVLVVSLLAGVVAVLASLGPAQALDLSSPKAAMFFAMALVFAVGVVVMQLVPYPYFISRMQNLVWSGTRSANLSFHSELRFWPLFWMTIRNWLLIVVTLGLYWPFAKIAMARLRLEAVSVTSAVDPDTLESDGRHAAGEAAGDAAGDFFGLDIGL